MENTKSKLTCQVERTARGLYVLRGIAPPALRKLQVATKDGPAKAPIEVVA